MNKQTLGALVAFAVLLLAFVATREKNVSVGVQKFDLPAVSSSAIESVTIAGPASVLLERGASGWTVADLSKAEAKFAADDSQVQFLLTGLAELKANDFVSDKVEKHAEFEVAGEKAKTVTVKAGATTFSIIVGKASKSGGSYVRRADSNAVFGSQNAPSQVNQLLTAWRKKTIATAPVAEIAQVDVVRADGQTYSVKAGEAGAFSLSSPVPPGFRVDAAATQGLVSQLASLEAQDFLASDGDFSKATSFTLTLKDGKTLKLTLAARGPDFAAPAPLKIEGVAQQYLLPSWAFDKLNKSLDDLRDMKLVDFDVAKVTKLSIAVDGKKTIVAKEGDAWKLVEPKVAPAELTFEPNQVTVQLNRLKSARAVRISDVAEAKAGLAKPSATIEATVDGKPVRLVFGGDAGSNELYARGSIDAAVYVVAAPEKASWAPGAMLFNKPPPMPTAGPINGLDSLPPEIREKLMQQLKLQQQH